MANSSKAKEFRERAQELRTIAETFLAAEPAERLVRLADDYDRMADEVDPNTPPKPSEAPDAR